MVPKTSAKPRKVKAPICGHRTTEVKRGNCINCYHALYRMTKSGETTFEELEAKGLLSPSKQGQKPVTSPAIKRARAVLAKQ